MIWTMIHFAVKPEANTILQINHTPIKFKKQNWTREFPLWCHGNESDWYPWGCGFNPWPFSVGQGSGVVVSCGVGHRCSSDLVLLWLWCRLAAIALIRPLAWELLYATGAALKNPKNKQTKKNWRGASEFYFMNTND